MIETTTSPFPTIRVRPWLGRLAIAGSLIATFMALVWAPTDAVQGDVYRIIYVHVPLAWLAYLAFFVVFIASLGWLWTKRPWFDALAVASAEVGVLLNPANPMNEPIVPAMKNTGETLNIRLHQIAARVDDATFDSVFTEMGTKRVEAFVVLDDPMLIAMAPVVAKRALAERLPSCGWPEFAESGGLIAYGIDFVSLYRHAATLVHKVLNGTTPAELPVERATRFFMVINRQTADTLGLHVPDVLLTRADQVIE